MWLNVGLREFLDFSFILYEIKLFFVVLIILEFFIWEVFVKVGVRFRVFFFERGIFWG